MPQAKEYDRLVYYILVKDNYQWQQIKFIWACAVYNPIMNQYWYLKKMCLLELHKDTNITSELKIINDKLIPWWALKNLLELYYVNWRKKSDANNKWLKDETSFSKTMEIVNCCVTTWWHQELLYS